MTRHRLVKLSIGLIAGALVALLGHHAFAAQLTGNDPVDAFLSQLEEAGDLALSYGNAESAGRDVVLTNVTLDFKADAPDLVIAEIQFRGAGFGDGDALRFDLLRLSDMSMSDAEGALSLAHLEMSGFELARLPKTAPGAITKKADPQDLLPLYHSLALSDFEMMLFGDTPRAVSVEAISVSASDYVEGIPLFSQAEVIGLSIPASALNNAGAEEVLSDLSLDRITAHFGGRTLIDPEERLVFFEDYTLEVEEMGTLLLDATVGNLGINQLKALQRARSDQESEAALFAMLGGTLNELSLTLEDRSMTAKLLALSAKRMNVSEADLIAQAQFILPMALSVLANRELQAQFTQEALVFLKDPRSFRVSIDPAEPIPLGILMAASQQLDQLITLLNLDVAANEMP